MVVISDELKDAIYDMIYDLDSHFPEEVLNNAYYEWFYEKYIKPISKAYIKDN